MLEAWVATMGPRVDYIHGSDSKEVSSPCPMRRKIRVPIADGSNTTARSQTRLSALNSADLKVA